MYGLPVNLPSLIVTVDAAPATVPLPAPVRGYAHWLCVCQLVGELQGFTAYLTASPDATGPSPLDIAKAVGEDAGSAVFDASLPTAYAASAGQIYLRIEPVGVGVRNFSVDGVFSGVTQR